jgi:acetyltransferase-like isoleucine patch superfamily enzyme
MTFCANEELENRGFTYGNDVRISRLAQFYNCKLVLGNNVRIDDFAIIKGHVEIGSNVHIGAGCIIGGIDGSVCIGNNVGISNHVSIYTGTEDFLSQKRGNPTMDDVDRDVICGPVTIGDDCIVGTGTIILPNSVVGSRVSISARCIINGIIPSNKSVIQRTVQKVI